MPNIRRTFIKGVMNKDVDERLLDDGYFRHAENVIINTSEGGNVGAVEKCLSNKQLTFLDLGNDIETIGRYSDETKNKLYWFVISSKGCFLFEYDYNSKTLFAVLEDTRVNKVLALSRTHLITGIVKIISQKTEKDLLIWTDNNMEVCCINIERVKKYGINKFEKEDIYLIKKPPIEAPTTRFTFSSDKSNNIDEKFLSFAYRYKYLDGDYSALSPFTNYQFYPKKFKIDYDTLDNIGMTNNFNAVVVGINTGDKRVIEIQVVVKESNSNVPYIVETFNKEKENWENDTQKYFTYSNNKLYIALPESEFLKPYNNIPNKAKALTTIGNRILIGNYTEGNDLNDLNDKEIKLDYEVSLITNVINKSKSLNYNIINHNDIENNDGYLIISQSLNLEAGTVISFFLNIDDFKGNTVYSGGLDYILPININSAQELYDQEDFQDFIQTLSYSFGQTVIFPSTGNEIIDIYPKIIVEMEGFDMIIKITSAYYKDINNVNWKIYYNFSTKTEILNKILGSFNSIKTNRDNEIAIVYYDEYKRASTALTCLNNTVFVPHENIKYQNKIKIKIKNKPPKWAKYYSIAVKNSPLSYENIYINIFYNDDVYVWCKLDGTNKDKVKEGDVLILKKQGETFAKNLIKTTVLEIKSQPRDFIYQNKTTEGVDIIEHEGLYMKIKPIGFQMNYTEKSDLYISKCEYTSRPREEWHLLIVRIMLFDKPINPGDEIIVELNAQDATIPKNKGYSRYYKVYYAQSYYTNIVSWIKAHLLNTDLWSQEGHNMNFRNYLSLEEYNDGTFPNLLLKTPSSNELTGFYFSKVVLRTSPGFYVFETEQKKTIDTGIFYQTEQTFKIKNGFHEGNISNQTNNTPAVIDLDFFNCYNFGNGVESYKIWDAFNKNYLNIDLRPTITTVDEYSEVTRFSDLTYSDPYVESTGVNGISSFNPIKVNWKELDKNNGAINLLRERNGNVLVFQEEKIGQVLFGKDAMYNADGTTNVAKVPYVLGEYIPYAGEYGMTHPESYAVEGNRNYFVDAKRGVVLRLSLDGIDPIVYGMEYWFKKILHENRKAKIIGGIDPYNNFYQISIDERPISEPKYSCGSSFSRYDISEVLKYDFEINNYPGNVVINIKVLMGTISIKAIYNEQVFSKNYSEGEFNFLIPVEQSQNVKRKINVTITPLSDKASYSLKQFCPTSNYNKVVTIVLFDEMNKDKMTTNGYEWGNSGFFYENDFFYDDNNIARFNTDNDYYNAGRMPKANSLVRMKSLIDDEETEPIFNIEWNKMMYLVTNIEYLEDDIDLIINASTYIDSSLVYADENNNYVVSDFILNEFNQKETLYLIWDYRHRYGELLPPDSMTLAKYEDLNTIYVAFTIKTDLKYLKRHEVSYRQLDSEEWSEIIYVYPLELHINQYLYLTGIDTTKSYEVRIRAVSIGGAYSKNTYNTI